MINFKEKSQVFILGMMAGLIVAGGFFILKLDDYFKELNFYKHVAETFYLHSKNKETRVKSNDTEQVKVTKSTKNNLKKKAVVAGDSMNTQRKNFVLNAELLNNHMVDTSIFDSDISEDIVVRKDELLSNKTLEAINLDMDDRGNSSDSLLQNVSGIRDDRNNGKQTFNVELWQSPLNYKGYRLNKNKIVVYGIALADDIKIFKLNRAIYFKNASTIYKMEPEGDFKPYKVLKDPSILEKLK